MADKKQAMTEAELEREYNTNKAILAARPKKSLEIPEDPNNPGDIVPVGWNGVIYAIPRGIEFEVPDYIYETYKYSERKTKEANAKAKQLLNGKNKEIEIYG